MIKKSGEFEHVNLRASPREVPLHLHSSAQFCAQLRRGECRVCITKKGLSARSSTQFCTVLHSSARSPAQSARNCTVCTVRGRCTRRTVYMNEDERVVARSCAQLHAAAHLSTFDICPISHAVQTVRCMAYLPNPDKYFSKLITGYIRL